MKMLVAIAKADLQINLRQSEAVLLTFLIPLGLLLFVGFTGILGIEVETLVPGLFALAVLSSAFVSLAIGTGFNRQFGVLKRFGATPVPPLSLVLGKALAVTATELLQVVLLWATAAIFFDWSPDVKVFGLLAAFVLGTVGPAGLALLIAGRFKAATTLALANGLYFVFLGIGDIFVPSEYLSDSVLALSNLLPAAPLAALFRWSTGVGDITAATWIALVAWAVFAPLLASRFFRWEE